MPSELGSSRVQTTTPQVTCQVPHQPEKGQKKSGKLTAGKRILEDLLEAQELEHAEVDGRVETETALVWTEGRVELHAVTTVDLHVSLVVLPDNAELDDALWDRDDLEGGLVLGVLLEEGGVLEGRGELWSPSVSTFASPCEVLRSWCFSRSHGIDWEQISV